VAEVPNTREAKKKLIQKIYLNGKSTAPKTPKQQTTICSKKIQNLHI
jgi:hypothetical protein